MGMEPCTIADVKAYKPEHKSIVSGQVLQCPYTFEKARLVVREMADALALDLVDKGLATNQLVLTVGYDIEKSLCGKISLSGAGDHRPLRAEDPQSTLSAQRTLTTPPPPTIC